MLLGEIRGKTRSDLFATNFTNGHESFFLIDGFPVASYLSVAPDGEYVCRVFDDNIQNQAGQYDKIIRENLDATLPVIIREILGLEIVDSEELPDDIQHTKERKPDALRRVTDAEGNVYVLHVEFQVQDEDKMVYRMAEYYVMLVRRYQIPVKQYVVFLGDRKPGMPERLETGPLKFNYTLVSISQANYKLFLRSENPEVKMLGILADFGDSDSYSVVKEIVEGVRTHTTSDFSESRYFRQLRIFVQLRGSLKDHFQKIMETVSKFFKEEDDYLFQKGELKGAEKERVKAQRSMEEERAKAAAEKLDFARTEKLEMARAMKEDGMPIEQIARFTKLSVEEIRHI